MSLKKFLAPNLVALFVLSIIWFSGVETVFKGANEYQTNLKKYMDVQRKILDNYHQEVDPSSIFKNSMHGFVRNLSDTTITLSGTPLDTNFTNVNISSPRESFARFERAYAYLANNYPEENMRARTDDAIRFMFRDLDPHSVYIEPESSDEIRDSFAGKFQGIGVQFQIVSDTITVISAISGGPSDKLGIQSGDRIVEIDGESSIGFTEQDVVQRLRGPKGTEVNVTIVRPNFNDNLSFTITRDDIPLYTVDSSHMLDETTGYIKINRFAATTYDEFTRGLTKLEEEGMERLILDMRNNPGGFLDQAFRITSEFFPRNVTLVSTKSRHARFTQTYRTRTNGRYMDLPIIVLVDQASASGSEILAGAVQDMDRGLIVGSRTFGKGLVQQQYELDDSSNIRVTISSYYTPSGRLIQKPFVNGREEYAYELYNRERDASGDIQQFIDDIPDSLKYETPSGRIVYGGGGIVPDHISQPDIDMVFVLMRRQLVDINFTREYVDTKGEEFRAEWGDDFPRFLEEFEWSEEDKNQIVGMMKDRGLVLTDTATTGTFKGDTLYVSPSHFEEVIPRSYSWIKADIARQFWDSDKRWPVINKEFDQTVRVAMNLWEDVKKLTAVSTSEDTSTSSQF